MIATLFSLLVGWLGLGLALAVILLAAWWFIPEVPWITHRVRQALLIAAIAIGYGTFCFGAGAANGITKYQAKLTRAINKAIDKGDRARAEALKKFDATKEIEDDGFARD